MTKEKETIENKADEKNDNWEQIESANFKKFEKLGDSIEGILKDIGESDRYGFGLYTLATNDGNRIRFHGSAQLDDLMSGVSLYDYIRVTYIDNQNTPQGQMKLFNVERKP